MTLTWLLPLLPAALSVVLFAPACAEVRPVTVTWQAV